MHPADKLSLKELTLKVVTLLAFLSGQRRQTLHALKVSCMQVSPDKCVFVFDKLLKTSKPGRHLSYLEFLSYTGGGVNKFSDRRISQKKLFGFRIWRIFYTDLRILLIQRIADLSNILARIVDLACNLVRILDCDFIVELLTDSNLDKTIV